MVVQAMLIRLCGDWRLARSIWDNVIRPNLIGNGQQGSNKALMYPWVITKDDEIGVSPNLKELTSRFLSRRLSNIFGSEDSEAAAWGGVKVAESFTKISVDVR